MNEIPEMDWTGAFASRAALMKSSALRELMKVTARPEIISFAGGMPADELFPLAEFKTALAEVFEEWGGQALQYSRTEGLPELRDWLARRFSNSHLRVARENVLVTTGAQQALDLIGRIFLQEGDRVAVENPTYLAVLSAWRPAGVEFLPAACDAGGLRVEDCEPLLERKPKAFYCVPNFQNPLGATLPLARRERLVHLARRHSMAIIEDNPYGLQLVKNNFLDEFVPLLRRHYAPRRDAMLEALEKHFPGGADWSKPEGGVFVWVALPEGMDAGRLLPAALERGVAFVPGEAFHLNGEGRNTMRLNFTNSPPARIEEGVQKLGALLDSHGPGISTIKG